jgi:mannitol/fructose-specific phosphotransferase system IIA component (Ntr-type)
MLSTRLTSELVQFVPEVDSWEEAIKVAAEPLLKKGAIEDKYIEAMIHNVKEFGPYIVLMPKVAMPHARPEDGVKQLGISLMVTEKSVSFNEEKTANIFFVLAADDATNHLVLLQEITEFLSDQEKVDALSVAKNYKDVLKLLGGDLS